MGSPAAMPCRFLGCSLSLADVYGETLRTDSSGVIQHMGDGSCGGRNAGAAPGSRGLLQRPAVC